MRNNEADPFNFEGLKKLSTWPKCLMKKVFYVFFPFPPKAVSQKKVAKFFELDNQLFWNNPVLIFFHSKNFFVFLAKLIFCKIKKFLRFFFRKKEPTGLRSQPTFLSQIFYRDCLKIEIMSGGHFLGSVFKYLAIREKALLARRPRASRPATHFLRSSFKIVKWTKNQSFGIFLSVLWLFLKLGGRTIKLVVVTTHSLEARLAKLLLNHSHATQQQSLLAAIYTRRRLLWPKSINSCISSQD